MDNQQVRSFMHKPHTPESFQEKINNRYPTESITVMSFKGVKKPLTLKCNTCGKILNFKYGYNAYAKNKKYLCPICGRKQYSLELLKKKLKKKFPDDDISIIKYKGIDSPVTLKCNKCGQEKTYASSYNLDKFNKYWCRACHPPKEDAREAIKKRFLDFLEESDLWELNDSNFLTKKASDPIYCKCKKCGNTTKKTMSDYLKSRGCIYCSGTKLKTTEEFLQELDDDYTLLTEYINAFTKVKLRHEACGFIYETTPHNYLSLGRRCPKCAKKKSKGELKIMKFLENNNIDYEYEKQERINGHLLRYDFYLPQYDLFIEYHGIQHYEPIDFFGGEARFKERQKYDNWKKRDNLLIIGYFDFDNIEKIVAEKLKLQRLSASQVTGEDSGKHPIMDDDIVSSL